MTPAGGTPTSPTHGTVTVLQNGLNFPTQLNSRVAFVFVNGIASFVSAASGPILVSPGDIITFGLQTVFTTATSMTVNAAGTWVSVNAVNL